MATSATSLHFLSLTPQSLSFSKPNATPAASLSLFSLPSSSRSLKLSSSSPFTFSARHFDSTFGSRFVRGVALSSEFDQIEEVEDEDEGVPSDGGSSYPDEHGFSPDLKLFVGNLPYNIDSAALAGLFQQAGNVEMVEVISICVFKGLYLWIGLQFLYFPEKILIRFLCGLRMLNYTSIYIIHSSCCRL